MKTYVSQGNAIDCVAPSGGVVSGTGLFIGANFVIPASDAAEGETFAGHRLGVFDHVAVGAESAQDGEAGDVVWFDSATSKLTMVSTGNKPVGILVEDKLTAAVTARLVLVPRISETASGLEALSGTLTGTVDGEMADVAATAGACAGGSSPSATNVDAAIATAVASIVTGVNTQLKELQTKVNAIIAS